jgi:hypothetical protein
MVRVRRGMVTRAGCSRQTRRRRRSVDWGEKVCAIGLKRRWEQHPMATRQMHLDPCLVYARICYGSEFRVSGSAFARWDQQALQQARVAIPNAYVRAKGVGIWSGLSLACFVYSVGAGIMSPNNVRYIQQEIPTPYCFTVRLHSVFYALASFSSIST